MASKVFIPARKIIPISDSIRDRYKIGSNRERSRYAHILLSAAGGQGKTAFIGTASRRVLIDNEWTLPYCNLFVIQYDPLGEDTFWDMGVEADIAKPQTEQELLNILAFLNSSDADQYDTVAIDAYNKLQDITSDAVLAYGKGEHRRAGAPAHDPEVLELRDYNRLYKRCRAINEKLIPINKHLIITCIKSLKDDPRDLDKEKDKRRQMISLSLDGKMAHLLSTQFSLHGVMNKEGSGTNTRVDTDFSLFNSEAKTRFQMEGKQADITFPKLLELLSINDRAFKNIEWKHSHMGFTPKLSE